jgi:RNA polymerase sigma factor (sigma-70 family)
VLYAVHHDFNSTDSSDPLYLDLIQEGNIGLMESVPKYDLSFNVRFGTFAYYRIRQRIIAYLKNNRSVLKLGATKALSKLHNHYDKIERSKLMDTLNVSEADIKTFETLRSLTFHSISKIAKRTKTISFIQKYKASLS